MTAVRYTLLVLVAMLAVSCGRRAEVHWRDGNFEVYKLDMDFSATMLGYNHHSGTVEGPFSEAQFKQLRVVRQLPEFTWKKKK